MKILLEKNGFEGAVVSNKEEALQIWERII